MENIFIFFQIHLILGMADYALTLIPVDYFVGWSKSIPLFADI